MAQKSHITPYTRHTTDDDAIEQIQSNLENTFMAIENCDIVDGHLLANVDLVIGENKLDHRLNRKIRGWIVTRIQGASTFELTGSINPSASASVTGVGTKFLTELVVGDRILVSDETRVVSAIASDTGLTVSEDFTDTGDDDAPKKYVSLSLYDDLDTSKNNNLHLTLNSNAVTTVDIWVF